MFGPIPLFFNLGAQEALILLGCCGFPVVVGATGAILAFVFLRQSKSKEEE
jgi:hypothetical protein